MVANRDLCKRSSEGSSRTPGRTMYKGHGSYVVVKGARLTTKHCHGSLSALPFLTMKRRLQGICIIDCDAATLNAIFAYYSTLGPADVTTINTLPSLTHDSLFDVVLYRRRKNKFVYIVLLLGIGLFFFFLRQSFCGSDVGIDLVSDFVFFLPNMELPDVCLQHRLLYPNSSTSTKAHNSNKRPGFFLTMVR